MKKKSLLLIILLLVITITIGASYALWQATHKQENKNVVSIGCFNLESDIGTEGEQAPISLMDAMPISDAQGMSLTPFTFTITNTCNMYATYQVNLETLSTTTLGPDYLKVALSNNTPAVLSSYLSVTPTISGANQSNKLISGGLRQGESITYNLRLWLDESTPRDAGSNKIYNGKISIVASPSSYNPTGNDIIRNLVSGANANSTEVITIAPPNESSCTNTLAYDGTTDNNLRYVGENPCNYVCFNNECPTSALKWFEVDNVDGTVYYSQPFDIQEECNQYLSENNITTSHCDQKTVITGGWRIIGLMNNVDDGEGNIESRLKIVRNSALTDKNGESYHFSAQYINQWGPSGEYLGADLMLELNGDYLNPNLTSNPMWYGSYYDEDTQSNVTGQVMEFERTNSLSSSAQELIDNAIWYTGSYNDTFIFDGSTYQYPSTSYNANDMYNNERSNNPHAINNGKYCTSGDNCNDNVTRTYSWTGKVALMYMSDIIFSVSGKNNVSRNDCLSLSDNLNSEAHWQYGNCFESAWLDNDGTNSMSTGAITISPIASTTDASAIGNLYETGDWASSYYYGGSNIYPTVYLKSSVKITGGDGSSANPYTLG